MKTRSRDERGIFQKEHGGKGTPEYLAWRGMRSRCYTPSNIRFRHYGARGISVCARWTDFANFLADMGPKPSPQHSLDRINNDGNYEPGNCRWATRSEQASNKRTTRLITVAGRTMTFEAWCRETGITPCSAYYRIRRGWDAAKAVTTPPCAPQLRRRGLAA